MQLQAQKQESLHYKEGSLRLFLCRQKIVRAIIQN